ncbi:MAG: hypothetical protein WCT02_00855 [Candidatus Paceibacterota bacterium]
MERTRVEALADVHIHLREGEVTGPLIEYAIAGGADVLGAMPNTKEGLTTATQVGAYRERVLALVPWIPFEVRVIPFLMITERTTQQEIDACIDGGIFNAKIYPYLRTTQSDNGVTNYARLIPILCHCGTVGMKCHHHPEHPNMLFGNREAEWAYLPLMRIFLEETQGIHVWEHGTDHRCIPHWEDLAQSGRFFVTLTAHHLAANEDTTFGDVAAVCKPPIKTEHDRQSLLELVAKDYSWLMAGGDSAFHDRAAKHVESGRCSCGDFTSPFLLCLYAHALQNLLEKPGGIDIFVRFTSRNARRLHGLPGTSRMVDLIWEKERLPTSFKVGSQTAVPFWGGHELNCRIEK